MGCALLLCCVLSILLCRTNARTRHGGEICLNLTASPRLQKFVDSLPTMPKIDTRANPSITLGAYKITQKLHRDLPSTTLYAFGTSQLTATYPGPTLLAEVGHTANVHWENHILDTDHILPIDRSLRWADPKDGHIPMVVHLHGQESEPQYDGHPNAWFTATGENGETYVTKSYVYPNDQLPTTLWYHDHTLGITRLNVAAGLAGAYVIHSSTLEPDWLPAQYHVLLVQDKFFYDDGYIKYPDIGINPALHPQWCPDYFGDVVLVNGKAWPYLEVAQGVCRFKLINAANSRVYVLRLSQPSLKFLKVGTDGGYLKTPILQQEIRIGPAERVEFCINFTDARAGSTIEMTNVEPAPMTTETGNQSVMQFRVVPLKGTALVHFPEPLTNVTLERLEPLDLIRQTSGLDLSYVNWRHLYYRPFVHNIQFDSGNRLAAFFLDGRRRFDDPATEIVKLYTEEVWCMINNIRGEHLIHTHLVNLIALDKQPFNGTALSNGTCTFHYDYPDPRSCYTGPAEKPDQDMVGRKDTVVVLPFHVQRFFVSFTSSLLPRYQIDPTRFPGYIWHCHLLEHEDNEMMRPLLLSKTTAAYTNDSFPPSSLYSSLREPAYIIQP